MGRASIKIQLIDFLMTENWKGPYSEDKRKRAERRRKRREVILNESLKHNGCASATMKTAKSCGKMPVLTDTNGHMLEDERDEDYKMFLDTYVSDIDGARDNNVGGSDIGVNTGYHSDNDDDADPEYKKFLENLRKEENSYVYSCFVGNQLVHIRCQGDEEEKRLCKKPKLDTKMSKDLTHNNGTGNLRNTRSGSKRKQTGGPMEYQTERGPCDKKSRQDVSSVPKNNCHTDSKSIGKSSSVRQNLQVSDQVFDTSELQCEIDEDYLQLLNSARIVDGDLMYMPDKHTTKTSKVEDDRNSSDSDLILIDPNSIGANTPFILSKIYDSSCFENEKNPRDRRQFSVQNHSQFRRRLMEYLERPYDKEECDAFLHEVQQGRQIQRHLETRQGVIRLYHTKGVNKSYVDLYPDLAKAIAKFKEPRRLLFLLRGFVFWLQNLSHDGVFRPWLDKSCLKILGKM